MRRIVRDYLRCYFDILDLEEVSGADALDSADADALRDRAEGPYRKMTPAERVAVRDMLIRLGTAPAGGP